MTPRQFLIAGITATITVTGAVTFTTGDDCVNARTALIEKMDSRTLTVEEAYTIAQIAFENEGCGVMEAPMDEIKRAEAQSLLWSADYDRVWYSYPEYLSSPPQ